MENEEKEDLLIDVTESEEETCDKDEEIDYYIRNKILDFIEKEKKTVSSEKKAFVVIVSLLVFLSSSVLVIAFPVYVENSTINRITTYGKLVTVSFASLLLFGIVHLVRSAIPKWEGQSSAKFPLGFGNILKISLLLSVAIITVFCLVDGNYVRCHLEDPLKGFSIVFSLLFYYIFSKKKMSIEKTFCAITIIVGVFVSVDFGICDKFRCNGLSKVLETTPKFHSLFVLLYLLSHAIWILHLTLIEASWTTRKDSNPNANPSILSNGFSGTENSQGENLKHLVQNLSIICQEEKEVDTGSTGTDKSKKVKNGICKAAVVGHNGIPTVGKISDSFGNSLPCFSLSSMCEAKKFPVTSTPKNETKGLHSWSSVGFSDVALWEHFMFFFIALSLCWLATFPEFNEGKPKLFVDVISDVLESFKCHTGWKNDELSSWLPSLTIIFTMSYVMLILSSLELLKVVQSTVTVVAIMMPALPLSSIFWSLFRMNENSSEILEFNPEITGEAVCAILGLPIIGIGIVLLLKSHMREFSMTA